jgi:choline monooxygenase
MTSVPSSDQKPLDGYQYHDGATFQRECTSVFTSSWHFVAHEERLSDPKDALVTAVGSDSLVLRRGVDGNLRAFHNICRHRGAPILDFGIHAASILRCPYHGWRYDDSGRLSATPGFSANGNLPPGADCLGLIPADVAILDGLVFIRPDTADDQGREALAPFPNLLAAFQFTHLRFDAVLSFDFNCNWKLYVENWLESYHLPWMHRDLARDVAIKNYTVEIHDKAVSHLAPRRQDASIYGGVWLWLWPLTAFNSYEDGISIERIVPISPEHTHIEYTFLFTPDATAERRAAVRDMCTTVTTEDGEMCELVHANIKRGRYSPGPLSPQHESAIEYFHRLVNETNGTPISSPLLS